jgi:diguanylate cyclase (GGDEF)-like protein/PAS domain S-box-containing protein
MKRKSVRGIRPTPLSAKGLAVCLSCLLSAIAAFAQAGQEPAAAAQPRAVLVVYSYARGNPWTDTLSKGIYEALAAVPSAQRPILFEEWLDSARLPDSALNKAEAEALSLKYRPVKLDAVITDSQQAAVLLLGNPGLFPGSPRYLFNFVPNQSLPAGNGAERRFSATANIEAALKAIALTLPKVRRVVAVVDQTVLGLAREEQLRAVSGVLPVEIWDDLTVEELCARAAALPKDSALFYLPFMQDRLGRPQVPFEVARLLSKAASVPVFSHFDTLLGSGIVGGYLQSARQLGQLMGHLAIEGDSALPSSQEAYARQLFGYYFDYGQLVRWRIAAASLPPGSAIVGRDETIWSKYGAYAAAALIAILAESLLIVTLFRLARQNRVSLAALAKERSGLESRIAERTAELEAANGGLKAAVSEREALLSGLRDSELKLRTHLYLMPLAAIEIDPQMRVTAWNRSAEEMFGFSQAEVLGLDIIDLLVPERLKGDISSLLRRMSEGERIVGNTNINLRKDGREIVCEWYNAQLVDSHGKAIGWASLVKDITEQRAEADKVLYLSRHDPLTGLLNRRSLQERLEEEFLRRKRSQAPCSAIMVDIDRFKNFNDEHGHDCGDAVLKAVASAITAAVRATDSVGRWGGEEFLILLPATELPGGLELAERIRAGVEAMEVPYRGETMRVTVTAGVASSLGSDESADACVRRADQGLLAGKTKGRNRVEAAS